MVHGQFNAGIGALIWSPEKAAYLLLLRSLEKDFAPGVWECVTGRLEQGEGFEDAVHREVNEEIGATIRLDYLLGTTHFYRGKRRPEVELVGIVYGCTMDGGQTIHLSKEHSEYRWVSAESARKLLSPNKSGERWLLRVIERDEIMRQLLPGRLLDKHNLRRFELDEDPG